MKKDEESIKLDYMILSRIKSDCKSYINSVRTEKQLWAGSVERQIAEMERRYNELPQKPEWLSMEDIKAMKEDMLQKKVDDLNKSKEILQSEEIFITNIELHKKGNGTLSVKCEMDGVPLPVRELTKEESKAINNVQDENQKKELAARIAYRQELSRNQRVDRFTMRQDPNGDYKLRCKIDGKWEMSKPISRQFAHFYKIGAITERDMVKIYYGDVLKHERGQQQAKGLSLSLSQKRTL